MTWRRYRLPGILLLFSAAWYLPAVADPVGEPAPAERFATARALGEAGNDADALAMLDALRQQFPDDVDYALARAQVLARQQRDMEALAELTVASELAPGYEAVWRLRYGLQARQPGKEAGRKLDELRDEASRRFPEANWWQQPQIEAPRRWTLSAGIGVDTLDNDQPNWNEQFFEAQFEHSAAARYRLRAARSSRFDAADGQYGLGAEWRFSDDWFAGMDANFSSDPRFLPDRDLGGHVGRTLADGWVAGLRYRHRSFPTATVNTVIGSAEKYFGSFRAAYSLSISRLDGAGNTLGHGFVVNWYLDDRHSFGVSLATGDEAEAIGPGQVLETRVRGLSVSGRHGVSNRMGISWYAGLHEQGDFYRRHYVGLAVSIRI